MEVEKAWDLVYELKASYPSWHPNDREVKFWMGKFQDYEESDIRYAFDVLFPKFIEKRFFPPPLPDIEHHACFHRRARVPAIEAPREEEEPISDEKRADNIRRLQKLQIDIKAKIKETKAEEEEEGHSSILRMWEIETYGRELTKQERKRLTAERKEAMDQLDKDRIRREMDIDDAAYAEDDEYPGPCPHEDQECEDCGRYQDDCDGKGDDNGSPV